MTIQELEASRCSQLLDLNPMSHYRARLIMYHEDPSRCRTCTEVDSGVPHMLAAWPREQETLWVELPQESYRDARTRLSITKFAGREAVLADLQVYQYEDFGGGGAGGGQSQAPYSLAQETKLQAPSLVTSDARIHYQIPVATMVSLRILDLTGRAVRELERPHVEKPGNHAVTWDATDNIGRKLPGGVYFCCLETQSRRIVQKLLLVR
jgi:hypothetical protein